MRPEGLEKTVAVIGLGKLGLVLAAAIGVRGMAVNGFDTDPERGAMLLKGALDHVDIAQERGLAEALGRARPNLAVAATVADAIAGADISFVVVPTPSRADGSFSAEAAVSALRSVGTALREGPARERPHLVVLVSTVSPGTTRDLLLPALRQATGGAEGETFCFCYAPALVALGTVLDGFLSPDFAFVGETDPQGGARLEALLSDLLTQGTPIHRMSAESVEIAKIGLNNFLTLKISFSNLIGQLCHASPGARAGDVLRAIGADSRVGTRFLGAGMGYGGPCLPRDTAALAHALDRVALDPGLPEAAAQINTAHTDWLIRLAGPVAGRKVCVYGLSYRAGSHISIASASIALANGLHAAGAEVTGVDPLIDAMDLHALTPAIATAADIKDASAGAEILVLTIPMPETDLEQLVSRNPDLRIVDVLGRVPDSVPGVVRFGSSA